MLLEDLMQPCPACASPYEYGEEACSSCLAWLTDRQQLDSGPHGYFARKRRARLVTIGSRSLLLGCMMGLMIIRWMIVDSVGIGTAGPRRDSAALVPPAVIGIGMVIFGIPGRTMHHYPSGGPIRRGRPRLWKGAVASAAFITLAIVLCELVNRPILQARAGGIFAHSPVEIAGAITTLNLIIYAAVALILLWNLSARLLGPQDMDTGRRKQLMRMQKASAVVADVRYHY
ncbi:hypothetical protein [Leifsonia sp. A12D58]|uniref:hypothetical protein n=1 Tax=Leifsonia sp. A12D58 TaxID=3397674 RepID=UPI0039DFD12B